MDDIVERMEKAAEREYDNMLQDDGRLKCCCGKLFEQDEGTVLSPNPYAMPFCPDCTEEYFNYNRLRKDGTRVVE